MYKSIGVAFSCKSLINAFIHNVYCTLKKMNNLLLNTSKINIINDYKNNIVNDICVCVFYFIFYAEEQVIFLCMLCVCKKVVSTWISTTSFLGSRNTGHF